MFICFSPSPSNNYSSWEISLFKIESSEIPAYVGVATKNSPREKLWDSEPLCFPQKVSSPSYGKRVVLRLCLRDSIALPLEPLNFPRECSELIHNYVKLFMGLRNEWLCNAKIFDNYKREMIIFYNTR